MDDSSLVDFSIEIQRSNQNETLANMHFSHKCTKVEEECDGFYYSYEQ